MRENILVINEKFYDSISEQRNLDTIKSFGYESVDSFFNGVIKKINDEYNFIKIVDWRFQNLQESKEFNMFNSFIEGNIYPFKKIIVAFSPINTKLGNTNIVQEVMPMICEQMEKDISFLLDSNIKKIFILTSRFNKKNEISSEYNTLQMNVDSLNTLNFDVISFFPVKNLVLDSKFNELSRYLEMMTYIQKSKPKNDQFKYFSVDEKSSILKGECEPRHIKGQWPKAFVFKFFTAIFSGKNEFSYDISGILMHNKENNQIKNLSNFINLINSNTTIFSSFSTSPTDDIIEANNIIKDADIDNIHRDPTLEFDKIGRKRYKTQRKIRDAAMEKYGYLCVCNDIKHFYFEASYSQRNYVEGHHIIPMNRQNEYWDDKGINLDVSLNIIPLCPNCHSQIHLGNREAKLDILSEIYAREEKDLKKVDSEITLSKLASYYNIVLDKKEEEDLLLDANLKIQRSKKYTLIP